MRRCNVRFGSKADVCVAKQHVRYGPKADMLILFDHLVGDREHARRNYKTERLCGLEIDDQLEFGWLYDGELRRLRSGSN